MKKIETLKNQNRLLSLTVIDALDAVMPKSKYVELTVNMVKNHKNYRYKDDEAYHDELVKHLSEKFGSPKEKLETMPYEELFQIFELLERVPTDIKNGVGKFIELNERGLILNKDVTSYKSLDELLRQVSLAELKLISKDLEKQIHKIYEDEEWLVLRPLSRESSIKYGAGTKWCTASSHEDYQYWNYTRRGILVYTINKKTGQKVATFKNTDPHHDHELSFWNEIDTRIDSYEANLPDYVLASVFQELKSTLTNREMSSEEDPNTLKKSHEMEADIAITIDPVPQLEQERFYHELTNANITVAREALEQEITNHLQNEYAGENIG